MKTLFKGAAVYQNGHFSPADIEVMDGIVSSIGVGISPSGYDTVFDLTNLIIVPGFADVHVHLRQPGFCYKETIESGTRAAAAGGYTAVCSMPNLNPMPDCVDSLCEQLDIIARDALIPVLPYACITRGEKGEIPVDFAALAPMCFAFSDDGKGVQREGMMLEAMREVKRLNGTIAAHCEDESMLGGGYIHAGEYAAAHGHRGISPASEWTQLARDIELAGETGCRYHMCHLSTKESAELVRRAKAGGVDISCETAPHYLVLSERDIEEDGRFKMNPPLRGEGDRLALIDAVRDGTIDMIATDHAPHSREEKSKGLAGSAMGVCGLETSFAALYTGLVLTGELTLEKLVDLMALAPRRRFPQIPGGKIEPGVLLDAAVIDLNARRTVDPERFMSMGRASPFAGRVLSGQIVMTVSGGKIVWQKTEN